MSFKTKFSNLGHPNTIWTVSAIHGDVKKLAAVHAEIFNEFSPGDRLVYTGNYFCGQRGNATATMEELLHFRRALLATPGVLAEDFAYLRGLQEELWSKILQIQFAPSAKDMLAWIAEQQPEMDKLIRAYGSSLEDVTRLSREGIMSLTKWSSAIKEQMRRTPGHEKFFTVLHRAAFTEHGGSNDDNLLFVHAGFNPTLPLAEQGDHFWWASKGFNTLEAHYEPFRVVIRGYDPEANGLHIGSVTMSIDGGCGRGGQLICAQISNIGSVMKKIEA